MHWPRELDLEYLKRFDEQRQDVSRLHNVKLFSLLPSARSKYYVKGSSKWDEEFKCGLVLTSPTLLVFMYYFDVALTNEGGATANLVCCPQKNVVTVVICFLGDACDGGGGWCCLLELADGGCSCSVLATLQLGALR